ncbi:signal peptidase I [Streptomyces coeruleoprunus]|uniref:Signal peptidase I n=1 Tax=Streptomyces coeruleoprunus TaxID=285563 RepID=A0ABV9XGG0_9ACTN
MDTEAQHTERDLSSDADTRTEQRPRFALSWRRTGLLALLCAVALLVTGHFVIQPFQIPSGSMEPTLRAGDRVLVNRLAYRFGADPARGDMIVFDGDGSFVQGPGQDTGTDFVKRVVGVGGDRVKCCDKEGRVEVNGVPVAEPYLYPGDTPSQVPFDIVVPQGTLWVMGDHRSQSRDSRDHLGAPGGGMVPVEQVVGRVAWIAWPASRWASLDTPTAFDGVPDVTATGGGHG